MNLTMKQGLVYLALVAICGCQSPPPSNSASATASSQPSNRCPENPKGALEPKNVKAVSFTNETANVSGQLRSGENSGYRFQGEAGKTLSFDTKEDICIWVFTPAGKVITDFKLSETAQYVVQVAAKQGNQTFSLQMSLSDASRRLKAAIEAPKPTISKSSEQNTTQTFSKSDFPKTACGDSRPSDPSAYPITFYPVNLPDTESNLRRARSQFCTDSYRKKSKDTGETFIQVASFSNKQNAKSFADLVGNEITGAVVGPSTTVHRPANE